MPALSLPAVSLSNPPAVSQPNPSKGTRVEKITPHSMILGTQKFLAACACRSL
jgi:hypothetical protein